MLLIVRYLHEPHVPSVSPAERTALTLRTRLVQKETAHAGILTARHIRSLDTPDQCAVTLKHLSYRESGHVDDAALLWR